MKRSIQDARSVYASNRGKLLAYDSAFINSIDDRFSKLTSRSAHAADYRRLANEVKGRLEGIVDKEGWSPEVDQPIYDGLLAFLDMVHIQIENLVAVSGIFGGEPVAASGWINAKTKEPIKVFAPGEKIANSARGFRDPDTGTPMLSNSVPDGVDLGSMLEGMFFGARSPAVKAALESGTQTAGGYTVPTPIASEFIDRLRAASVFVEAGARTVMLGGGTTRIVRLDTDPTATWRAENGSIGDSDITVGSVNLTPKSLSTLVKVPYELLSDSVNIAEILLRALTMSLALELDRAALFGSGSGNEPLGLFSTSGINSVSMGTNGATPASYDDMLDMMYELEMDNARAPTAAIWHPRTARTYRKLKDTQNNPLMAPEPIASLRKLATTSVPINQTQGTATGICSTVLTGDFSEAILGVREELTILKLDQSFAANGQIGFWARLRADIGFAHGASFCKLLGVKA